MTIHTPNLEPAPKKKRAFSMSAALRTAGAVVIAGLTLLVVVTAFKLAWSGLEWLRTGTAVPPSTGQTALALVGIMLTMRWIEDAKGALLTFSKYFLRVKPLRKGHRVTKIYLCLPHTREHRWGFRRADLAKSGIDPLDPRVAFVMREDNLDRAEHGPVCVTPGDSIDALPDDVKTRLAKLDARFIPFADLSKALASVQK
jgi:hypothetical protein